MHNCIHFSLADTFFGHETVYQYILVLETFPFFITKKVILLLSLIDSIDIINQRRASVTRDTDNNYHFTVPTLIHFWTHITLKKREEAKTNVRNMWQTCKNSPLVVICRTCWSRPPDEPPQRPHTPWNLETYRSTLELSCACELGWECILRYTTGNVLVHFIPSSNHTRALTFYGRYVVYIRICWLVGPPRRSGRGTPQYLRPCARVCEGVPKTKFAFPILS